ncbi:diketogulonate reductase-like aldo/keto reductase [Micromonospora pisi]|uniref:Diketogulonate reductase-like aldo/keto reductase n=1 Tax=Micromonospora pisi TaxID=589240 RepID=A0A495JNR7_9ACTN|nr:aldo/keto reductase [Micromonospora pisi]RKR90481.1 diketogulonate reductase-like aldo/keto reductase [Micromonospora pisi]
MTSSADQPTVALPGEVAMPLVGFGTWQATGRSGYESVRTALEAGYRHIDTATAYGNEDEVGRALRDSGVPREEVFLTTKLPPEHAGHERRTLAASLAALGTDYVDLWLIHWPPQRGAGLDTWQEFLAVRDEGQARAIGVSNYSTSQLDVLIQATSEPPAVNQIRWSPSLYDPQVVAEHRERGIAVEGYSPFKTTRLDDPVLIEIARAHGVESSQVVLRWHVDHGVVVIPKSVTPDRIRANFDVFDFSLNEDELRRIDGLAG